MKGKRYTTEQKVRILRRADEADATILDVCREAGISDQKQNIGRFHSTSEINTR